MKSCLKIENYYNLIPCLLIKKTIPLKDILLTSQSLYLYVANFFITPFVDTYWFAHGGVENIPSKNTQSTTKSPSMQNIIASFLLLIIILSN